MLAEMIEARQMAHQPTIMEIKLAVAGHFHLRLIDMVSESRARAVARPRQIAMYLAKEITGYSLPRIGRHFGNRNRTTVMHACIVVDKLCESDLLISTAIDELRAKLRRSWVELGLEGTQ
jgi:chromosomal replication initiator protein